MTAGRIIGAVTVYSHGLCENRRARTGSIAGIVEIECNSACWGRAARKRGRIVESCALCYIGMIRSGRQSSTGLADSYLFILAATACRTIIAIAGVAGSPTPSAG